MYDTVIKIENLYKEYCLGVIGHGTLYRDLQSWWAKIRGTEDPNSIIGASNGGKNGGSSARTLALRDINLEIKRGEILGVIGKNGAGKSTLLKIISRITTPSKGCIKAKGRIGCLLEVGTGFHPELTGLENIYLNGAVLGMNKAEVRAKIDDIVDFSGVGKYIDTPVKRYSSGMHVRLGFSVAAHLDPEILLIDEVLAVGDAEFQKKCLGKIGDVSGDGRTVIFVSHNMTSIARICKRVILLDAGQVIMDDTAQSVIADYLQKANRYDKAEVIWADPALAPGDGVVRLHAVRVLSEDGLVTTQPDICKEILIQIDYWNFLPGGRLCPLVVLTNLLGEYVFASFDLPSVNQTVDPLSQKPLPAGLFRTVCRIPANMLNDISYSLTAGVDSNVWGDGRAVADDVVQFEGFDSGAMRGEYAKSWPGYMRPRLGWFTEYLGDVPEQVEGKR